MVGHIWIRCFIFPQFCLPPNCRSDDFNVLMPDEEEFIGGEKKLNVSIVSMNIKFGYDILLSEIVYHLHNGLCQHQLSSDQPTKTINIKLSRTNQEIYIENG